MGSDLSNCTYGIASLGASRLDELMNSVRGVRALLSEQMVTRDQFERYHTEYSNLVVSTVEDAVSPIRQDLSILTTRVEMLENSQEFLRDPK